MLHSSAESLKKRLADKKTKDEDRQRLGDDLTALALEQSELPQPVSPEIIATDTTVEALASLMSLTGETAGIFTDEADFFKIIAGLYNKGQSGNLGLVLNAYDGAPFYRIRGCGTVGLSRPLLSLCLFAQPVLFAETQDNSDLQGRGMVGRLLFCEPVMMAGKRNMRSKARIDSESEDSYKQLLQGFLDTPQSGYDEMPVIGWENDAADCMLDYLQSLEDSMKSGNPMEDATDYASKAGGAAVRIAGILHLLWTKGEQDKISLITAKKAITVHCYFFAEKLREMQKTETREEILLKRVLEKLWELTIAKDRAYTTVSALQRKVKNISGLKSAAELEPFLEMLQAQNLAAINPADKNKRLLYVSPYFQI